MTYPQQPDQPPPYEPSPYPGGTARRRRRWPWIIGAVAAVLLGLGGWYVFSSDAASGEATAANGETSEASTEPADSEPPSTPEPAPDYVDPEPEDFQLDVKILNRHCQGSDAPCNVTYRIIVTDVGPTPVDPDETYEVAYEVSGVLDGPRSGTFTASAEEIMVRSRELALMPSADTKLIAKATGIRP